MNETDLNTISKLKELRDKNALTQEEFDKQVAIYLNSDDKKKIAKSTEKKKTQNTLTSVLILGIGIGLYGQTIIDELYLDEINKICKNSEHPKACDCLATRTVKKLPFTYKLETVLGIRDSKTIPGKYVDIIDDIMCSMHMM